MTRGRLTRRMVTNFPHTTTKGMSNAMPLRNDDVNEDGNCVEQPFTQCE